MATGTLAEALLASPLKLKKAGEYANPEGAGEALPWIYGDLTSPSVGAGIFHLPKIDATAEIFGICGRGILSSGDGNSFAFYDDNGVISSANYAVTEAGDLEGKGTIAYVDFSVATVGRPRGRCKGIHSGSSLVTNPIDVAEDILLQAGFTSDSFHAPSLERARAFATSQGYKAAGVIDEERAIGDVIQQILGEFLGEFWVDGDGKIRFFLEAKGAPDAERLLVGGLAERDAMHARITGSLADIVNQPAIDYAYDWVGRRYLAHDAGDAHKNGASQALYGKRLPEGGAFRSRWVRDAASAGKVQEILGERFGDGAFAVEVEDGSLKLLSVERGDLVRFSASWAYERHSALSGGALRPLRNQILRVLEKEVDPNTGQIRLSAVDTGAYLTSGTKLDGSETLGGSFTLGSSRDLRAYE